MPQYRVSVPSTTWTNYEVTTSSEAEAIELVVKSEDFDEYYASYTDSGPDYGRTEVAEL